MQVFLRLSFSSKFSGLVQFSVKHAVVLAMEITADFLIVQEKLVDEYLPN